MSTPFIPGLEKGTSEDGNLELSTDDIKHVPFTEDRARDHMSELTRSEILDFGDEGFLLHNVLSEKECRCFIDGGEAVMFDVIRGAKDDYRGMKRITVQDDQLAELLWARVKKHVHDIVIEDDPHKIHIHGPPTLMKGTWTPIGLNNVFRLCRYLPGGHFAPHFDGHYDRTAGERSLKTLMLYLNGDFIGGATNFVDESQTLHKDEKTGKYCAEEKNILCSIHPEAGLAILFNHHRLHEGAVIRDGQKYILRTDIMFRNVTQQTMSADYTRALDLLQQAETLENGGECMKAAELYRKAFKLSPELEFSGC